MATRKLVGTNGDRSLWFVEVPHPTGAVATFYEGKVSIEVGGVSLDTPGGPTFRDQASGNKWLETGKVENHG